MLKPKALLLYKMGNSKGFVNPYECIKQYYFKGQTTIP